MDKVVIRHLIMKIKIAKKIILSSFLFSIFLNSASAEYYSGSNKDEARIVRAPIWVFIEGQPALMSEDEGSTFTPPKEALQEVARFLLSGMSYGWKFTYTPHDKSREVKEVFELVPISEVNIQSELRYSDVRVHYPYVSSWVEYPLSSNDLARHSSWNSLKFKTIKGSGEGRRKDELEGVKTAYINAIKMAIVEYAKKTVKNRPKEIIGEILLKNSPRLFCASGLFKAEVELYINVREVIPYSYF